jgi:excisionase family DNA binding protein
MADDSILLTLDETADALRISKRSVSNLIAKGELAYTKVGKRTMIRRETLVEFAKLNEFQKLI